MKHSNKFINIRVQRTQSSLLHTLHDEGRGRAGHLPRRPARDSPDSGGNYVAVYLENRQKLLTRKTLKEWETMLPPSLFIRIHRATIVNTGFIEQIAYAKDGSCEVHLSGHRQPFAVSRRMASGLKSLAEVRKDWVIL